MSKRKADGTLADMVIAITGTLSVPRAQFEALITANGGSCAKTVTNSCTHLVSSETGTKKCSDAEAKGVKIVNEDWIRTLIGGGGSVGVTAPPKKSTPSKAPAISLSAKAPTPSKTPAAFPTGGSGSGVRGLTFAITGTLSVPRAEFEALLRANGAEIANSVTKSCTHLISAETGTKKCQDAEAKGLTIVNEAWVRARISGGKGGGSTGSAATKPAASSKRKAAVEDEDEEDEDEDEDERPKTKKAAAAAKGAAASAAPSGVANLKGMVIAITGTLSVPRAQFEKLITSNGGQVAKSVTNACTHLVSSETGTKKCADAEEKGVKIVDEDWIRAKIDGSGDGDDGDDDGEGDEDEDGDEEENEDEDDSEENYDEEYETIDGVGDSELDDDYDDEDDDDPAAAHPPIPPPNSHTIAVPNFHGKRSHIMAFAKMIEDSPLSTGITFESESSPPVEIVKAACRHGNFTSFEIIPGDWEAYILHFPRIFKANPKLKRIVIAGAPQSGCGGYLQLIRSCIFCPELEYLDCSDNYENMGQAVGVAELILQHRSLKKVVMGDPEELHDSDYASVVKAIKKAANSSTLVLEDLEGFDLNKAKWRKRLGLSNEFERSTNAEILMHLKQLCVLM